MSTPAKAPAPVAPKPPAPAPKPHMTTAQSEKAAQVIETGKPIPADATAGAAVIGQDAARMTAASRTFEIEDGIPLPVKRIGVKGESMYPFDKLGVGQTFFVGASPSSAEPWKTLTSMASRMTRAMHPKTFVTARETKNGIEGVRIWRGPDATTPLEPPKPRKKKEAEAEAEVAAEAAAAE